MIEIYHLIDELTSEDECRAEAAVHGLAALGESAASLLEEVYNRLDGDEDMRWWALRALAEIHSEHSKKCLITALGDESNGIRYCAALGLRQQPTVQAIPKLVDLLDSADKLLARLAADALIHHGEEAVPALLAVMEHGIPGARLEAVRALARIGDKRTIPELFDALEGSSALLEYWANEGLENMGVGMVFYKP